MSIDVCIVGAGPAGLSAAAVLARHGCSVTVVDESPEPGGRLLGQLHRIGHRTDQYHQDGWWNGRQIATKLAEDARAAGATIVSNASVWGISPGWQICITGSVSQVITANHIVLATGAAENALPIPGWTLPGVLTIGAAQVLATQHRVRPSESGIVVGINPLSMAIAHELHMSGVHIAGLVNLPPGLLTPPGNAPADVVAELARVSHLAPSPLLRTFGKLGAQPGLARLGARFMPTRGMRVWGIPMSPRRAVTRILGSSGVEGVVLADLDASGAITKEREIEVDGVFIGAGLRPLSELAGVAGCLSVPAPDLGGSVPLYGPQLETSEPGVFVAGNIIGITSATVAIAQGKLAAHSILGTREIPQATNELAEAERGAPLQFLPSIPRGRRAIAQAWDAFARDGVAPESPMTAPTIPTHRPLAGLPGELVVCRCEEITVGAVRHAAALGAVSSEELKRFTRMTMGACQGRVCQGVLGRLERALTGTESGPSPFPGNRPPVRPVTVAEMAALAGGDEEQERLHGVLRPILPFGEPTAAQQHSASSVTATTRSNSRNGVT